MNPATDNLASPPSPTPMTHFAQLGGDAAVVDLVEAFYRHMDTRQDSGVIRAMHAPDLASTKAVLVKYLCEWLGGPQVYSAERGHPRLRMRHAAFAISESERDAWLACMNAALTDIGASATLHATLMASFFKTADWMRNTGPNPATISTTTQESP